MSSPLGGWGLGNSSYFNEAPDYFFNSSFGTDSAGAFGSFGGSPLATSGILGAGGSSGSGASYGGGGGFGSLAQFAPLLAGRFGSMLAGNANTAQSAQNAMGTSIGMFDVNQGVTAANRRQAIFDEMMAPIQASRIKMNPEYRRGQLRDTLQTGTGRYSAFVG
jgi:hypothetical protein